MKNVSVTIITNNEERNIEGALRSAACAGEIIVIDSGSTDRTLEICGTYNARVYTHQWQGYARQKQTAIGYATLPWVFVLDSDERLTEELVSEIELVTQGNSTVNGYYVSRKNFFLGKWIRHGGWHPDNVLRLFRNGTGQFQEREVHEKIIVDGTLGYLKNPIEHYTYETVGDFIKKMDNYSTLSAREIVKSGRYTGFFALALKPPATFIKMYIFALGFLDGLHGFILSLLYAVNTFLKYLKAWEHRGVKLTDEYYESKNCQNTKRSHPLL
ncbi:MAG: glycosyltransferase family 2 protein [Nitrospirae bacterium]|nr:glycosyltransferase family 2 protein [Nitrospirota bacterium]MBF0535715.1 glycosyltransferase family 2 protein [Nitrospirota bacterium]MBF0617540.1 glycosyltransferase family 2 protein [Nitrospirota bacterium]